MVLKGHKVKAVHQEQRDQVALMVLLALLDNLVLLGTEGRQAQVVLLDLQEIKAQEVIWVLKVTKGLLDLLVSLDLQDFLVITVLQVKLGCLVPAEQQELQEVLASPAQQGQVEVRANLGLWAIMALQVISVNREKGDHWVLQDPQALQDSKALLVHLDPLAPEEIQVRVDPQVIKGQLDHQVLEDLQALSVLQVK